MAEKYLIEQFQDKDNEQVVQMMKDIFLAEKMRKSGYFNREYWNWQYKDNPSGAAVTLLARDNGSVIAQYANIPTRLKINDKIINISIVIDLMVREAYRRKGLFKQMGEASAIKMSEMGMQLSLGFPRRKETYAGLVNKLGWFVVGELKILVKPLLLRRKVGINNIRVEEISNFPAEIDSLWARLKENIQIGIERDSRYLNWRYFKNPAGDYKVFLAYRGAVLSGYIVLKIVKVSGIEIGLIVDLFCIKESSILDSLIRTASNALLEAGVHLCGILRTRLYEDLLKKIGFKLLPRCLSSKNYTLTAKVNQSIQYMDSIKDIDNWYITFGDWDVV